MKLQKLAGATSEIFQIFVADSSSTTGAGLTGLLFNTASLTAYYHRDTDTTATAITLVTMTVGAFTSSGFKEIDATNMPGWYQFCPPNAALASGAKSCSFHLKGATNMAPLPIEVQLTAVNPDSATAFVTGINSVAPPTNWNLDSIDASGRRDVIKVAGTTQTARDLGASVLLSSGTGTGQINFTAGVVQADSAKIGGQTASAAGTVTFPATLASTTNITAGTITTVTNLTNAPTAGDLTATMKTSVTTAATAATPVAASVTGNVGGNVVGSVGSVVGAVGSVTGSVGSVVGAVGSVAGNVGGNVTGTVGSVVGAVGSVTAAVSVTGDLSATMKTSVQTASAAALTAYDGPTNAQLTTALNTLMTTALSESYAADGATMSPAQALYEIRGLLSEFSISGVTMTLKKKDGATTAATYTLNDATAPTSITRAS